MLTFLSLGMGESALRRDSDDLDSSTSVKTSTSGASVGGVAAAEEKVKKIVMTSPGGQKDASVMDQFMAKTKLKSVFWLIWAVLS